MFGIDSPELLVIAIVALIVIGPKELPGLLRTWGRWMSSMRGMASEFRGHVDEMIRQSELDQVKKQLEDGSGGLDLKSLDPTQQIREHIQEGIAEGDKALADAKSTLENPLAEPDSAPQVGADVGADTGEEKAAEPAALPIATASVEAPSESPPPVANETEPAHATAEEKPAKAAAE